MPPKRKAINDTAKSHDTIRIVIADDHKLFLDGMRLILHSYPDFKIVGEAQNGKELLQSVKDHNPNVIITDINMPVMNGIEATHKILSQFPSQKIIALSMHDDEEIVLQTIKAGAKGYLLKNSHRDDIIEAVKRVANGETYLHQEIGSKLVSIISKSNQKHNPKEYSEIFTQRELTIIRMICEEYTNKEIAERLTLSVRTVEVHKENIMGKINVETTIGIVKYAIQTGVFHI